MQKVDDNRLLESKSLHLNHTKVQISWKDVSIKTTRGQPKTILNGVSGSVMPG